MRRAQIKVHQKLAGILKECPDGHYEFNYETNYQGPPVSLTMPVHTATYHFDQFPPFFEGLLPEGVMLETLLRQYKLNQDDYMGQLLVVGQDVIGAVTIEALP